MHNVHRYMGHNLEGPDGRAKDLQRRGTLHPLDRGNGVSVGVILSKRPQGARLMRKKVAKRVIERVT